MRLRSSGILFLGSLLGMSSVAGAVATGPVFGSHMVLQRGIPIPVFGTGTNGESVTVTLGTQSKTTTVANGAWKVNLDAQVAGGPYTMTIKGATTLTYSDVMVGEVWHCAGQSNMDTRMSYSEYPNLADSIKSANYPKLRYITTRQPNQTIQWQQVSPTSVGSMTATGYFFGRNLLSNLEGVAVGIVNTSVGGTVIKTWLDPVTLKATSDLAGDAEAGTMYTSWVKSVEGYGIKGTVWLQGENDASSSALVGAYNRRLDALIKGWRKSWAMPAMPFVVVGLCHKGAKQAAVGEASNQALVRESQRQVTDTMDNSWLSVEVDLGDDATWHYPQKPQLGKRIGELVRGAVYGQTGFVHKSPRPSDCFFRGSTVVVPWDVFGGKLVLSEGSSPTGFALAGSDGKWSWASTATLKGDTVFLTTSIAKPTHVRFAWANQPIMNLFNAQGLPATPFELSIAATSPIEGSGVRRDREVSLRVENGTLAGTSLGKPGHWVLRDVRGSLLGSIEGSDLSWTPPGRGIYAWRFEGAQVVGSGKVVVP
ncbi:MAG: hypothetical protein IPK50_03190 [Fibrobacterota bacterium]|nr:hypothetical protein [Fibrobacterota bacterium]QQS05901.1 MAG: hypothetical protein IPK50_03190 [Fibrobacterota bacterium]